MAHIPMYATDSNPDLPHCQVVLMIVLMYSDVSTMTGLTPAETQTQTTPTENKAMSKSETVSLMVSRFQTAV